MNIKYDSTKKLLIDRPLKTDVIYYTIVYQTPIAYWNGWYPNGIKICNIHNQITLKTVVSFEIVCLLAAHLNYPSRKNVPRPHVEV